MDQPERPAYPAGHVPARPVPLPSRLRPRVMSGFVIAPRPARGVLGAGAGAGELRPDDRSRPAGEGVA